MRASPDRPHPHPSIETAYLPPEAVLFDDRSGAVHHLNPAASAVWMLVDGVSSAADLTVELSTLFGVPESTVRPDVDAALADFAARGLLDDGAAVDPQATGGAVTPRPPDV